MKKVFLTLISFIFFTQIIFAQNKECDINNNFTQNAQFFFNSFQEGTVVYKDNLKSEGLFNYNVVSDDIYFIDDNKYFSLDRTNVKYVVICNYRFYFSNTKVYELVYSKNVQLVVQRTIDSEDLQNKKGAYGATSPNAVGIDLQYADIVTMAEDNSFQVNLPEDNDKTINVNKNFKIKSGNKFYPATKRTLLKIYKENKKDIEIFLDNNQLKFNTKEDLIEILNYCTSL